MQLDCVIWSLELHRFRLLKKAMWIVSHDHSMTKPVGVLCSFFFSNSSRWRQNHSTATPSQSLKPPPLHCCCLNSLMPHLQLPCQQKACYKYLQSNNWSLSPALGRTRRPEVQHWAAAFALKTADRDDRLRQIQQMCPAVVWTREQNRTWHCSVQSGARLRGDLNLPAKCKMILDSQGWRPDMTEDVSHFKRLTLWLCGFSCLALLRQLDRVSIQDLSGDVRWSDLTSRRGGLRYSVVILQ